MNPVDLGLTGLFLISIFYGYRKGFVKQLVGFMSLFLSLLVAYSFTKDTAVFLQEQFPLPEITHPVLKTLMGFLSLEYMIYSIIGFFLLFIGMRFLCGLLGRVLQMFAEFPIVSWFNRGLGAFLSSIQLVIVLFIATNMLEDAPGDEWKETFYHSVIIQYVLDITPLINEQLRIPKPKPEPQKQLEMPTDIL